MFEFNSKANCFQATVKTQKQCINISVLTWQHVAVLLDHLEVSIQRYEVQSLHWLYLISLNAGYNKIQIFIHCRCVLTVTLKELWLGITLSTDICLLQHTTVVVPTALQPFELFHRSRAASAVKLCIHMINPYPANVENMVSS